jgi:hypothetical protein
MFAVAAALGSRAAVPAACWVAQLLWAPLDDISLLPPPRDATAVTAAIFCRYSMLISCGRHAFISHAGHHTPGARV